MLSQTLESPSFKYARLCLSNTNIVICYNIINYLPTDHLFAELTRAMLRPQNGFKVIEQTDAPFGSEQFSKIKSGKAHGFRKPMKM